jgi:two-component system sensor histidine kinase GlrK
VDVREIIKRVADDQRLALRARGLTLDVNAADVMIPADSEKLRVVLDNLLSNAVKFSPQGGLIRLTARLDGNAFEFDVTDQGPGVPFEERVRIFDPFYQGQHHGAGPVSGTGIGLSVVKEYVFAHGGSVEVVDSSVGAHLRVRLPLEWADTQR